MKIVLRTANGFEAEFSVLKGGSVRVAYDGGASVDLGKWHKIGDTLELEVSVVELLKSLYENDATAYTDACGQGNDDLVVFNLSDTVNGS